MAEHSTIETEALLGAIEQLYRDVRGIDASVRELRSEVRETPSRTRGKAKPQPGGPADAVTLRPDAWGLFWDDLRPYTTMAIALVAAKGYVALCTSMPLGVVREYLPASEWIRHQYGVETNQDFDQNYIAQNKQLAAFSNPGDLLRKGETVEGYTVTSSVGWRHIFGAKDWHEGYDLNTPIGTPLHAVLPVTVNCSSSGGGGLQASYTVGNETHWWIHLSECNPGTYRTGEVFAKGNSRKEFTS
jgi:murein DD-endopeptidase MepM/ murein hydrolase activator NlpD